MIVGADLGGSKLAVLVDDREHRFATGPECTPSEIEAAIRSVVPSGVRGLGIGVPGLVRNGVVVESDVLPRLAGWRPEEALSDLCATRAFNDAEAALCATVANLRADVSAVLVIVGTGVGCAITEGGRVVAGVEGWAGELGACPVPGPNGAATLDDVASGACLVTDTGLAPAEITAAVERGDPQITAAVRRAGEALGLAVATCINLLNPQHLTLAGGTLQYPGYTDAALGAAERWSMRSLWRACEIRVVAPGTPLVAHGAARLVAGVLNLKES
jgi:predicted NBD/HSP70 family sugar kinase